MKKLYEEPTRFGQQMMDLREQLGINQREMSSEIGVLQGYLGRAESGTRYIKTKLLNRIIDVYKFSKKQSEHLFEIARLDNNDTILRRNSTMTLNQTLDRVRFDELYRPNENGCDGCNLCNDCYEDEDEDDVDVCVTNSEEDLEDDEFNLTRYTILKEFVTQLPTIAFVKLKKIYEILIG